MAATAIDRGAAGAEPDDSPERRARRALAENPRLWYHTIELAPGIATPGYIDLRKTAERVLPDDLSGKRALDVGPFDGFWSFEIERRGAEVLAADVPSPDELDIPPPNRDRLAAQTEREGFEFGRGFRLAAEALGSGVVRVERNVYDLDLDAVGGPVDFAFAGAILIHLRNPVLALERIRSLLAPGGELRSFEPLSARMTLRSPRRPAAQFRPLETDFTWWLPNLRALSAWPRAAGFDAVRRVAFARPPCAERTWYAALACTAAS